MFRALFEWPFIHLRQREMFLRLMIFRRTAQSTHEVVGNFWHRETELLSLKEAHLTTLCPLRNSVRLELLGTQVVVSKTPKSLQRKKEEGPGERQSLTFVVPDDVEKIAEQEHERDCEVGIRDPSVQHVRFCRMIGSGPSILTFFRSWAHLEDMEFCRESEESRGDVLFNYEWFRIVCWVRMQVDMGTFDARKVFLMSLIGFLSLGRNFKNLILFDL
jgi:hypothetical protein